MVSKDLLKLDWILNEIGGLLLAVHVLSYGPLGGFTLGTQVVGFLGALVIVTGGVALAEDFGLVEVEE